MRSSIEVLKDWMLTGKGSGEVEEEAEASDFHPFGDLGVLLSRTLNEFLVFKSANVNSPLSFFKENFFINNILSLTLTTFIPNSLLLIFHTRTSPVKQDY